MDVATYINWRHTVFQSGYHPAAEGWHYVHVRMPGYEPHEVKRMAHEVRKRIARWRAARGVAAC